MALTGAAVKQAVPLHVVELLLSTVQTAAAVSNTFDSLAVLVPVGLLSMVVAVLIRRECR